MSKHPSGRAITTDLVGKKTTIKQFHSTARISFNSIVIASSGKSNENTDFEIALENNTKQTKPS